MSSGCVCESSQSTCVHFATPSYPKITQKPPNSFKITTFFQPIDLTETGNSQTPQKLGTTPSTHRIQASVPPSLSSPLSQTPVPPSQDQTVVISDDDNDVVAPAAVTNFNVITDVNGKVDDDDDDIVVVRKRPATTHSSVGLIDDSPSDRVPAASLIDSNIHSNKFNKVDIDDGDDSDDSVVVCVRKKPQQSPPKPSTPASKPPNATTSTPSPTQLKSPSKPARPSPPTPVIASTVKTMRSDSILKRSSSAASAAAVSASTPSSIPKILYGDGSSMVVDHDGDHIMSPSSRPPPLPAATPATVATSRIESKTVTRSRLERADQPSVLSTAELQTPLVSTRRNAPPTNFDDLSDDDGSPPPLPSRTGAGRSRRRTAATAASSNVFADTTHLSLDLFSNTMDNLLDRKRRANDRMTKYAQMSHHIQTESSALDAKSDDPNAMAGTNPSALNPMRSGMDEDSKFDADALQDEPASKIARIAASVPMLPPRRDMCLLEMQSDLASLDATMAFATDSCNGHALSPRRHIVSVPAPRSDADAALFAQSSVFDTLVRGAVASRHSMLALLYSRSLVQWAVSGSAQQAYTCTYCLHVMCNSVDLDVVYGAAHALVEIAREAARRLRLSESGPDTDTDIVAQGREWVNTAMRVCGVSASAMSGVMRMSDHLDLVLMDEHGKPTRPLPQQLPQAKRACIMLDAFARIAVMRCLAPVVDYMLDWMLLCVVVSLDSRAGLMLQSVCKLFASLVDGNGDPDMWATVSSRFCSRVVDMVLPLSETPGMAPICDTTCLSEAIRVLDFVRTCGASWRLLELRQRLAVSMLWRYDQYVQSDTNTMAAPPDAAVSSSSVPSLEAVLEATKTLYIIPMLISFVTHSRHFAKTTQQYTDLACLVKMVGHGCLGRQGSSMACGIDTHTSPSTHGSETPETVTPTPTISLPTLSTSLQHLSRLMRQLHNAIPDTRAVCLDRTRAKHEILQLSNWLSLVVSAMQPAVCLMDFGVGRHRQSRLDFSTSDV